MLDAKIIAAIVKQVQRQFPEVVGVKPNIQMQHTPQAKNNPVSQEHTPSPLYLVTFRGAVATPEGKSIPRLVRVVVNADGKIKKITTSR